jgi:hypothetical protein
MGIRVRAGLLGLIETRNVEENIAGLVWVTLRV